MKKATIRFIIMTGMLLKLFSVTAYAENALASSFVLAAGFLNGENPVIDAGVNLDKIPLFDESSPGTLSSSNKFAENMSSSTTTFAADTNEGRAAILAAGTFLTVSAASAPYTGTVNLSATLRKIFPPNAVSGKTITFKLDGDVVGSAQTDKNGTASLQDVHLTDNLNVGPHAIKAEFAGDGGYSGSTGLGLLTVTYAPTQLSVDNVSATFGSTVTIRGRLTSVFTGKGLKDKVLTVFINNEVRGMAATDADGVGTLDVDLGNLDIGTYPILVTFLQVIGNYSPNTASATLKVEELPTLLTVNASDGTYGGNVRLEAALSASGAPVMNQTVKFTFNGSSYSAQTDALGIAAVDNVSISGIDAGVYKGIIAAEFASSGIYSGSSSAGDLTVDPAPTALSVSNSEGNFGGLTGLTARLTSGGVPLSGRTISFKMQDTDAGSIQTDAEGTAFLPGVSLQGIDAGEYDGAVTASFQTSGNYASSSGTGDLTVLQAPTTLSAGNAGGTYKGITTLTAVLASSGIRLAGMTISFSLNGISAGTAVTDNDGLATLGNVSMPEINVGKYDNIIHASFSPSEGNYMGSSASAGLEVTPASSSIIVSSVEAYFGSTISLKAVLSSGVSSLSGRTVSFTINDIPKGKAVTGADGTAILENVSLDGLGAGTYNNYIGASFTPSADNYSASSGTANLTVKELPTLLTVSTSTGTYGGKVTLEARLTSSDLPLMDKSISFSVNGIPAGTSKTLSNGTASVQFSLTGINAGTYPGTIKAEFTASDNYASSSASGDLIVNQAPSSLTVAEVSGTYSGSADFSAELTSGGVPLSGMTVSFKLNGNPVGEALTGIDGIAVIKHISLIGIDAGEYEGAVTASFQASGNYASSSASGKLKVEQAASLVVVKSAVGTYNGKVILTAVLTAASSGIPLGGRTVYFKLNEEEKGSALTGDDGVAELTEVSIAGIPVGNYESCIEAGFPPSGGNYAPSKGKGSLEVGLAPTSIALNKITAIYGGKVDLEATLTCYGAPLSGKPVEFSLNGQLVGAAVTNNEGKAIKNCIDLTGIGAGVHPGAFCASFLESNPYKGCSSMADIEITKACTQVRVLPVEVQYSDQVTLKAVVTSAAQENLNKSGGSVEFKYQLNNEPENTLGTVLRCAISDGKMVFSYEFTCDLDPDQYKIFAEFTPSDQANFNGSCNATPYGPLLVEPEDALVEYTGNRYFSTPPSGEGTPLTLSASITDTADYDRGDISNARVEFREAALGALYNDWIVQATNLPVILSDQADNTAGTSTAQPFCRHLSQSEINNSGTVFDVYTKVRGNYTRLSSPSLVTIGVSGNDNISGGGFIVPKSPAGKYCGSKGEKTDFGFTMKYGKSCESVPGQAGIIIRGGNGRIYQVMSRAISSLSAYPIDNLPGKAASFSAKSDLIDITNPFNQVTLSREVCLTIQMYEDSKDCKMDAISITLLGVNSELLYSNNWDGSKTLPQNLDMSNGGGTIKVLGSSVLSGVDGEAVIPKEYALFQNYPNPFNPSTTIQYDLPEESNVKIAIYDILGKKISQIVNGEVPAGRHRAVWNSQESGSFASGIYILHIYAESLSSKRNIISSKKMLLIK